MVTRSQVQALPPFAAYECEVIREVETQGGLCTSDAQGLIETHADMVRDGFAAGTPPAAVAAVFLRLTAPALAFASVPRPATSPWGQIQGAEQVAPGIWLVSTASHGGFIVSPARRAAMPEHLRTIPTFAGGNAYEEDCDWSIVVMAFPDVARNEAERAQAVQTFNGWIVPRIADRKTNRGQQALAGI